MSAPDLTYAAAADAHSRRRTAATVAVLLLLALGGCATAAVSAMGGATAANAITAQQAACAADAAAVTDPYSAPPPAAPAGTTIPGLTATQSTNVHAIVAVARQLRLPDRAAVIAIATAKQESDLGAYPPAARPNADGDAGLFQLRVLPGWHGTLAQVTDPTYASRAFYLGVDTARTGGNGSHIPGLVDIKGWETLPLTVAAQRVQRSAYPDAYAQWEGEARAWYAAAAGAPAPAAGPQVQTAGYTCPTIADPALAGATAGTCSATPLRIDNPDRVRIHPNTQRLVDCAVATFPRLDPITYRGSSGHGQGWSVDLMVPAWDTAEGAAYGDRVASWVWENRAALCFQWMAWRDRKVGWQYANGEWQPYTHFSGSTTPDDRHLTHLHIDVRTGCTPRPLTPAAAPPGQAAPPGAWVSPIARPYRLSARYGQAGSMWSSGHHTGLDFAGGIDGRPILSVADGTVTFCGDGGAYGSHWVKVAHPGGVSSEYAHGTTCPALGGVRAGQRIGTVGTEGNSTGPHLHLEIRVRGQRVNPETFLRARGVRL